MTPDRRERLLAITEPVAERLGLSDNDAHDLALVVEWEGFRVVSDETMRDERGVLMRVMTCEEYDPESARWEPFLSVSPARPVAVAVGDER